MSLDDKLTPEIAALIAHLRHTHDQLDCDDYQAVTPHACTEIAAAHALESLAQQVQLLRGADEERARLRKALERIDTYKPSQDQDIEPYTAIAVECKGVARKALAASPTGYTERLEQLLETIIEAWPSDDAVVAQGLFAFGHRIRTAIVEAREALGVK